MPATSDQKNHVGDRLFISQLMFVAFYALPPISVLNKQHAGITYPAFVGLHPLLQWKKSKRTDKHTNVHIVSEEPNMFCHQCHNPIFLVGVATTNVP